MAFTEAIPQTFPTSAAQHILLSNNCSPVDSSAKMEAEFKGLCWRIWDRFGGEILALANENLTVE